MSLDSQRITELERVVARLERTVARLEREAEAERRKRSDSSIRAQIQTVVR